MTITDSTIINNEATWGGSIANSFYGGPITIQQSCIFGNTASMYNLGYNPDINAPYNWWGPQMDHLAQDQVLATPFFLYNTCLF